MDKITICAVNNRLVCAEGGGNRELIANRDNIGEWEVFHLIRISTNQVALQVSNGKFVCAEPNGGRIIANRDVLGPWETFVFTDLGGGEFALQSHEGAFVCAENAGDRQLVANRAARGPWETFTQAPAPQLAPHPTMTENWVQVARENLMQGTVEIKLTDQWGSNYTGKVHWRRYSVFPPWYTFGEHDNNAATFVAVFICDPYCDVWFNLPFGVTAHQIRTDAYGKYTINPCLV